MQKIPTIFKRDFENKGTITEEYMVSPLLLQKCNATEKVDGINVRVTIRNHTWVRLEKRRNPSRKQKEIGIIDPWYVDANPQDPEDQYIFNALNNSDLSCIPDGVWEAEAVGPKIQGNPLELKERRLYFFSLGLIPVHSSPPIEFKELCQWLHERKSKINPDVYLEGIVWHFNGHYIGKIKRKDFKRLFEE